MHDSPARSPLMISALTVATGVCGAVAGWALGIPAAFLLGPALAVTALSLTGLKMGIADGLRDSCMVALGLGIGAGFTAQSGAAFLRWPLAFLVLSVMLILTVLACRVVLERVFDFDRHSAGLAAIPGHLSLVIGIAAETGADVGRIALVQTIRVLALTLTVPFAALALGIRMQASVMPAGVPMQPAHLGALTLVGIGLGLVLRRFALPAPMLLGPLAVSALGHVAGLTPGAVPSEIMVAAFVVLGSLIGSRFSGMTPAQFRSGLLAGLATTCIAVCMAALAALPVAASLDMPVAHVLTAFGPGGLETMVALGAAMGASPGFVTACHVMRLLILSVLITVSIRQSRQT